MITNVEEENFNPPLTSPVQTSSGKITGFVDEANEVQVYLGIPYAEPPTGALRYKPTKELVTPYVERVCTEHAPAAPQTAMPFDTLMCVEIEYQSEDCLYLNVWVPVITANNKKLPVIVWFHPGACMR
ncbi:Carboxylesterase [Cokeromyces recurvatus]|uniref:Carboxylesterase n=1 Tax=Cokeromyces recurvatus TaxID=90255 RepID=UPI0022203554|nr:Carboxylesterase [Cokeromyces recurvatus]KAI7906680.1 Carboxylesterase [Cokeromyces recurvatus]